MKPLRIGIAGRGRMGQAIARSVEAAVGLQLAGTWGRGDDLGSLLEDADVLIDFSLPGATATVVDAALAHGTPLVCGVSGLDEQQQAMIDRAAQSLAVVYDRNMSSGIAVLDRLVREAARSLGPEFGASIREVHHVHKADAPSGTALQLGAAVVAAADLDEDDIHYESERRGEVPGEHTVVFRSPAETVSIGHSVTTRQVFVDGAIRAARWVVDQPAGRYRMSDVLS